MPQEADLGCRVSIFYLTVVLLAAREYKQDPQCPASFSGKLFPLADVRAIRDAWQHSPVRGCTSLIRHFLFHQGLEMCWLIFCHNLLLPGDTRFSPTFPAMGLKSISLPANSQVPHANKQATMPSGPEGGIYHKGLKSLSRHPAFPVQGQLRDSNLRTVQTFDNVTCCCHLRRC